jgi:hypothetical protein
MQPRNLNLIEKRTYGEMELKTPVMADGPALERAKWAPICQKKKRLIMTRHFVFIFKVSQCWRVSQRDSVIICLTGHTFVQEH